MSDQPQAKALHRMTVDYRGTDALYTEMRERIEHMNEYLESKRLSDFLEALSDERLPAKAKLASLLAVWKPLRRS